jgi:hypothetical protein
MLFPLWPGFGQAIVQSPDKLVIGRADRLGPGHEDDIDTDVTTGERLARRGPEPAPDAVALDCISGLARRRQSDADAGLALTAVQHLNGQFGRTKAATVSSRRLKLCSLDQPDQARCGRAHAVLQTCWRGNVNLPGVQQAARPNRSGRQALAAMGAAGSQHLAAANGGHACAEAVAALADELARLVGSLHGTSPVIVRCNPEAKPPKAPQASSIALSAKNVTLTIRERQT